MPSRVSSTRSFWMEFANARAPRVVPIARPRDLTDAVGEPALRRRHGKLVRRGVVEAGVLPVDRFELGDLFGQRHAREQQRDPVRDRQGLVAEGSRRLGLGSGRRGYGRSRAWLRRGAASSQGDERQPHGPCAEGHAPRVARFALRRNAVLSSAYPVFRMPAEMPLSVRSRARSTRSSPPVRRRISSTCKKLIGST